MGTAHFGAHALVPRLSVVIVAGFVAAAAAGWGTCRRLAMGSGGALGSLAFGAAVSLLAARRLVRRHERALVRLSELMEGVHRGGGLPGAEGDVPGAGIEGAVRRMLARLEDESHALSGKLLACLEAERHRIGRELHDETSQTLALVLLHVDEAARAAREDEVHEHLDAARDLLDHTLDELKNIVYGLKPVLLESVGLAAAVRWYVGTSVRDGRLEARLDLDTPVRPPAEVETALYRIVQEAVNNAVKHAEATRLTVELQTRAGYASVAVLDNGRGFDVTAQLVPRPQGGLGLLSIRERVQLLGGTLDVVSAPERGTRLHVVVPYAEVRA